MRETWKNHIVGRFVMRHNSHIYFCSMQSMSCGVIFGSPFDTRVHRFMPNIGITSEFDWRSPKRRSIHTRLHSIASVVYLVARGSINVVVFSKWFCSLCRATYLERMICSLLAWLAVAGFATIVAQLGSSRNLSWIRCHRRVATVLIGLLPPECHQDAHESPLGQSSSLCLVRSPMELRIGVRRSWPTGIDCCSVRRSDCHCRIPCPWHSLRLSCVRNFSASSRRHYRTMDCVRMGRSLRGRALVHSWPVVVSSIASSDDLP